MEHQLSPETNRAGLTRKETRAKSVFSRKGLANTAFFKKSKIKNNKMFGMGLIKNVIDSIEKRGDTDSKEDQKFKTKLVDFYNSQVYSLSNKRPFLLLKPKGKLNALKIVFKTVFMFNQIKENVREYGTDREIQIVCKYSENQDALFQIKEKLANLDMLKGEETKEAITNLNLLKSSSFARPEDKLNIIRQTIHDYNKKDTLSKRSKYLIDDSSHHLNTVLFFRYALLFYSILTFPLILSLFEFDEINAKHPFFYLELTSTLFYSVDMGFSLLTVSDLTLTVQENLKKKTKKVSFLVDLVSLVPFSLILSIFAYSDDLSLNFNRWIALKLIFLFQLTRLLKYRYFQNSFDLFYKLQSILGLNTAMLNFTISMTLSTVIVHLFACVWVFTSKLQQTDPNSWFYHYEDFDKNNLNLYFRSIYFSASILFTVGYGDLTPFTNCFGLTS